MIALRNIAWHVDGVPVVENVNLEAAAGEFVALMGANGAGKSTVLELLAGIKRATAGAVVLNGRPLHDWAATDRARFIGHLPQAVPSALPFTVDEIVHMGRYPHAGRGRQGAGMSDRWFESDHDRQTVERAMLTCDCLAFRGRLVSTLSGGERQRVLLAACLAQEPSLLLLDEPSAFLDVDHQLRCFSLLRDEAASGRACIAVTHDVNLALAFCTRLVVLAGKRLACDLTRSEALERHDWLPLLSSRLEIVDVGAGASWVIPDGAAEPRAASYEPRASSREPQATSHEPRATSHKHRTMILTAAIAFCAAAVLLPFLGPAPLELSRVWNRQEPDWSIFVQLRISRTLLGLFAGAALALGGSVFQAMLRDALATPDTLGVSSGASLGAVAAIAMGWHLAAGVSGIWAGAFAGATAVLILVVLAATRAREISAYGLLLAGVATNSVCWALILVIHGVSGMSQSFAISRWLIGSLDATDYRALAVFVVAVTAAAILVMRRARQWNLLTVGEAWVGTRGGDARHLLRFGYVAGSFLAASTVALTGPIGFIGLVVPHLVRLRVSADDRVLMPCAFCFGGVLLASCDALGRVVIAPAEVPAGAITACIGGPYLFWLLSQRAS